MPLITSRTQDVVDQFLSLQDGHGGLSLILTQINPQRTIGFVGSSDGILFVVVVEKIAKSAHHRPFLEHAGQRNFLYLSSRQTDIAFIEPMFKRKV